MVIRRTLHEFELGDKRGVSHLHSAIFAAVSPCPNVRLSALADFAKGRWQSPAFEAAASDGAASLAEDHSAQPPTRTGNATPQIPFWLMVFKNIRLFFLGSGVFRATQESRRRVT